MNEMMINGIVILLYILCVLKGYKKGFFCAFISLVSLGIALFCAYLFSPVVSKYIMLLPSQVFDSGIAIIDQRLSVMMNQWLWFVIIFFVIRIVLRIIESLIKVLQNLPLVKQVSAILGACLGLIEATIYCLILCVICCLPLFENGTQLIQKSLLKPIQQGTSYVLSDYVQPLLELEEIQSFDSEAFTDEQVQQLETWFIQKGYESSLE